MTIKRLGFCCKWIDHAEQVDGIKATDDAKQYNTGSTTVSWLNRQTVEEAEQRLWDLMVQNIESTRKLVERVGSLDQHLRMVRISSDILPVYTHDDWKYFWLRPDVVAYCEKHFGEVGDTARRFNVRLSFHPGQYTVLASNNPGIVQRSIEEFEYHTDMARWMGYGKTFQDLKINIHIGGREGPEGIRRAYSKLTPEARNCITIENEEISYGLDDCLSIGDLVPITVDLHHHWLHEGEYLQKNDPMVQQVLDSWRGVRPTCHYSLSRTDYLVDHSVSVLPDYLHLIESGYKKQKLRAHSDFMWNAAVNDYALEFLETHDIMVEAKGKNLASFALAQRAKELNLL